MINEYENTLRKIIIDVIGASDENIFSVSDTVFQTWLEKREKEKERNNGFLFDKRIIYYADLNELKQIFENNWSVFAPILKDRNRFMVFYNEMVSLKALSKQGKELTNGQNELASGITKDLKNTITIFNNQKNNKDDFFIEIKNISDNLGTTWEKSNISDITNPILKVNDDYELFVNANDPKDRDIEYELYHFAGSFRTRQKSNRFNFKIEESLIGKNTMLVIKASTPKAAYKNEAIFKIQITVLPN